jgi:hypothetical protein
LTAEEKLIRATDAQGEGEDARVLQEELPLLGKNNL